jgi:hypothetical protein
LNAVIGDDAFDTAQTDGKVGLAQLLGDDRRGSLGVQKAVAQDLADGLVGAAKIGFRSGLLGLESGQASGHKSAEDLVITLTTITIFLGDGGHIGLEALAFDKHGQAAGLFVGGSDEEGAGGAGELICFWVENQVSIHGRSLTAAGQSV